MSGLVPRPCYSVQHLQNCCHETKSRPWVNTYITLPCGTCEPASQRELLRIIYSFSGDARGSIHMSLSVWRPRHSFQQLLNCWQDEVVVGSACTFIRLRAATLKRLLKESGSGASSSLDGGARRSIYMLRALVKVPKWRVSAGSLQMSVSGTVLEAQAGLHCSGLDCRPRCSSQQTQSCSSIKTTSDSLMIYIYIRTDQHILTLELASLDFYRNLFGPSKTK